jgi:hypothetical protein
MPPWRGAQLKKHVDRFTFTFFTATYGDILILNLVSNLNFFAAVWTCVETELKNSQLEGTGREGN